METRKPSKSLEGRRVQLQRTTDAYTNLKPGDRGTVSLVDDAGTVHVKWDDGSSLGLVWEAGDRWTVLPQTRAA